MKTKSIAIAAFMSAIFLSCNSSTATTANSRASDPIPVETQRVEGNSYAPSIVSSGQVAATQSANVSTRLMGSIRQFHVAVGDKVSKGQLLVEVSITDMKAKEGQALAALAAAQSAFQNAENDYRRFQNLFENKSATEKELENVTTRYQMAKSGLEIAQNAVEEIEGHMEYALIRAPFDGIVVNTFGKAGDMAFPGAPLLTIESADSFEVIVGISEADAAKVIPGTPATVHLGSVGKDFSSQVIEISRSSKNTGSQYLAKLSLEGDTAGVLAGMFASATIHPQTSEASKEIWISSEVLIQRGQLKGVFLAVEEKALFRWIRIGKQQQGRVEVLSGLQEGELLITDSDGLLLDGSSISL